MSIKACEAQHYPPSTYQECESCFGIPVVFSPEERFMLSDWVPISVCPDHKTAHFHYCSEESPEGSNDIQKFKCPELIRRGESNVCPYTGIVESVGWCESEDLGCSKFRRTTRPVMQLFPVKKEEFTNKWLRAPGAAATDTPPDKQDSVAARPARTRQQNDNREGKAKERIRSVIRFFTSEWQIEALADDACVFKTTASDKKAQCMVDLVAMVDAHAQQLDAMVTAADAQDTAPYVLNVFDAMALYLSRTSDWYDGGLMVNPQKIEWLTEIVCVVGAIVAWSNTFKRKEVSLDSMDPDSVDATNVWAPNRTTCISMTLAVLTILANGGHCVLHERGKIHTVTSQRIKTLGSATGKSAGRATILLPADPDLKRMLPPQTQMSKTMKAWIRYDAQRDGCSNGSAHEPELKGDSPVQRARKIKTILNTLQMNAQCEGPLQAISKRWMSKLMRIQTWFSPNGELVEACVMRNKLR